MSIGDNVDDAYALASLAIGVKDWAAMTDEQFKQASDFLRDVHKNVRLYWTDNTDLSQAITSGEVDLVWAWNETATTLRADGIPAAIKKDTAVRPGSGLEHLEAAAATEEQQYDFLNAATDPAITTYVVGSWGYSHANARGMAQVDSKILAVKGYADVSKFPDAVPGPDDRQLRQKLIAEFAKIKSGY
ncbi:type 2 periplasmic-binding domain-containing protein [Sinorhizobium fredii]|uniref:hypothetical protein n=1 Tax=Rhizobium fredii TaxID=380 RepID=UPI000A91B73D|nr:hypothetical protein [Sinorhizobium fredii]WOS65656.1 hypothetical protein SFGR64A_29825 [Sinorhizobium fredii GR64]